MDKRIVACVNGYDPSETVCEYAEWIARKTSLPIQLLHTLDQQTEQIVNQTSDLTGNLSLGERDELLDELVEVEHEQKRLMLRRGKIVLEKSKRHIEKNGALNIEKTLLHGRLQPNLMDIKDQISLLIIGRYGQAHFEQSTTGVGHKVESLIRSLEVPILVVVKPFKRPSKVLVTFDGSANSEKVVSFIKTSNLFNESELHLIHVGTVSQELQTAWSQAQEELKMVCKDLIALNLEGEVSDILTKYQNDNQTDLTIMGAFGHHWLRNFLMGSTTSAMLAKSSGALLLIR